MTCERCKSQGFAVVKRSESRGITTSATELHEAAGLYQSFNDSPPSKVIKVRHARVMPPVVVHLGELIGVIYRSQKGKSRAPRTYIHFMESPPKLVSNALGTQFYIVGGNYRVSPRGIEG